uniref:Kalirin n=1 Tax=Echinococcus granulosus TaxID=6210 RepID=A0A068WLQ1_ECHGR|nr:kalirin [Echinococcus granulosus]
MDHSSKHIDSDVLDFYRPSHIGENRLSSSGHNCHLHDQHSSGNQHRSQGVPQLPLHVKVSSGLRVPLTAAVHTAYGVHPQLPRVYQQGRPQSASQHHLGRQVHPEIFRHSPQSCQSNQSGCTASVSSGTSGYASLNSNCKGGHKPSGARLRAAELIPLLRGKYAMLPGGRTRNGGPILCFPANSHADFLPLEELYFLVLYLTYLPEENVKKLGFAVIIGMRSGTTWHSVKPVLKVIEECIGGNVAMAYIIKPDKYLEKQKVQMSIGKFSFNIQLVSVEQLFLEVDASQLTADLEGTLPYNHEEWIQIRCCLEEFFMFAHDMSDKFSQLYCFLDQKQNPESVEESKRALEDHRSVRLKVMQAPVPALEAESDRLTAWLRYGISAAASASASGGAATAVSTAAAGLPSSVGNAASSSGASYVPSSWVSMNPDFQQLIPQVRQTVTQLYEFRAHLQQKWETGRTRLEQIYQFRLFEDDASRMTAWLEQQSVLLLTEHADIGETASQAVELHNQHRQFLQKCSGVREQVSRLTGIARMLADTGHFAGQQMLKQANELEHERKSFTTALEERSRVLQLSTSFHTRAEAFLNNCTTWETSVRHVSGTNVNDLNQALRLIQERWQDIQQSYEEACRDGRAMVDLLSAPVTGGSHTSLTAAIDYSQGRKHCADLVHELWAWYKRLERTFTDRKSRLTSRLALLMFKEDVGQVLTWLSDHGEPFLARQTAIGKSSQRAEQLYNAHMQFEQVAANTLTNADKLISAVEELASQAENPREVRQEAAKLQQRITSFTNAVDSRREMLDLACGFYGHTKEVLNWLHNASEAYNPGEHFPPTIEGMDDELTAFRQHRDSLEVAVKRVVSEGKVLISRLQDSEEAAHLRSILTQVTNERDAVWELLGDRQMRLELCMQLRLFEADVHNSMEGLRRDVPAITAVVNATSAVPSTSPTAPTAATESNVASAAPSTSGVSSISTAATDLYWISDPRKAPSISALEEVNVSCTAILPKVEEVLDKGGELIRIFESVAVNFPAGGPGSSDSGVGDSSETAVERVHRLISELGESVATVDEINERVSNELDWRRLQSQSRQVLKWIGQCEVILYQTAVIPTSLAEAEAMQTDHDKFQPVLNDAHPEAVQCAARASYLLQSVAADHPRRADFQAVAENVAERWQKLVYAAEEKHKLLIAATNWYKTSEQVISVLRSLEKDYRREEDWCRSDKALNSGNVESYLNDLLSKHGEQKEAFLKACILARRTSELFMKYLHRQPPTTACRTKVEERIRSDMADLMAKEQAVLEAWAAQRRRFEECVKFVTVEAEMLDLARRILQFVGGPVKSAEDPKVALPLLPRQSSLFATVKRACQSLKALLEAGVGAHHSDSLLKTYHRLNACVAPVETPRPPESDSASAAAAKMRSTGTGSNRTSVSSTGSSGVASSDTTPSITATVGLTEEQRKLINRRQNILRELVTTERAYVLALRTCLETFHAGTMNPPVDIPVPSYIAGKESIVYGNLEEIYHFHEKFFEPEICKYASGGDFLPEDVGHCFVSFGDRLAGLYVEYCVNKEDSMQILVADTENFFGRLQLRYQLSEPLQSFLIKPVQRITKYQLLLREIRECCDKSSAGELSEGLDVMMAVPKKANEAIHLRMLQGLPEDLPISCLGDVVLQDQFTVWEPKQLIKKSRERRVFLFDICLVLAKECPVNPGESKMKYQFKSRFLLADLNITEHIEGDQCKFALWAGRVPPVNDYRLVLKAPSLEVKQTWVRAIREAMRERMFSMQSLHQDSSAASGKLGADSVSTLDAYYIRENYQAQGPNEISVAAHQIVQLVQRTTHPSVESVSTPPPTPIGSASAEREADGTSEPSWALVRFVVTGSASSPNAPVDEGFIPVRLIGAPVYPRAASVTAGGSSGGRRSMRRWLPSAGSGTKERRQVLPGTPASGKRGSKADMAPPIPLVNRSLAAPTQHPATSATSVATQDNTALLDNVSEESVELELPPPMVELQALPTASAVTSAVESETDVASEVKRAEEDGAAQVSSRSPSTLNISTMGGELQTANSEINLSRMVEISGEADGGGGTGPYLPPVLTGVPSDLQQNALGALRIHGALRVATQLVGALEASLADLTIGGSSATDASSRPEGTACTAAQDEELLKAIAEDSTTLCFVNRHLLLFDQGLVIADAAVEAISRTDGVTRQMRCQFRHFLSSSQIALLEDISVAGSRPTEEQVLWFCVSERPRRSTTSAVCGGMGGAEGSLQSHLCHVLAPHSPEVRIRWLSELNAALEQGKRCSAIVTVSGDEASSMSPPLPTKENSLLA